MTTRSTEYQLANELRTVIRRLIMKLRSNTEGIVKMSLTEHSTLALLDHHKELLPSELAAMEKITTQSMSQILNNLSQMGYINRRISRTDKRKSIISLSKTGQLVLNKVRGERDEWMAKALKETCTPKEIVLLKKAIVPLTKLVDYEK